MITSLFFKFIGLCIFLMFAPILLPLWALWYAFKWLFIPHSWWKRDRILIHPSVWTIRK